MARLFAWSRTRGADAAALGLLAAAAAATWYFRVLRPADVPFAFLANEDFFTQTYPMWVRIGEWWRSGIVPLWNPYQYAGHPVLACAIYGVLYPPNLLHLIVSPERAIELLAVAHLAVAGGSMYAYAATIGLTRPARFVAGALFPSPRPCGCRSRCSPSSVCSAMRSSGPHCCSPPRSRCRSWAAGLRPGSMRCT
jgi:hypothetical protein